MNDYDFIIAPEANRNLIKIEKYLTENLQSPQSAHKFLLMAQKKIKDICKMPTLYSLCTFAPLSAIGVRYVLVNNYKLYFTIDEEKHIVNILFIKHCLQEIK